ncbi:hypothetical protein, partial [Nocardia cerradoensis]|uniref:hypothetical protein n=1 Tax=Nocardia cerradoensis TaxID=85688 RepID=UPI00117EFEFB
YLAEVIRAEGEEIVARLTTARGVPVPVRAVFDAPTVAELARVVGAPAESAAPDLPPLTGGARLDPVPLSIAQQRMWFLNRFDNRGGGYQIPFALR